ncbi:beta-xylosidase [Rhizobium sp. 2YAF20]|uniref:GH39 family glycosyl hydrolase n=1 Tax=Rhizobium sp. 2YAF20 TaxID=3233027 RepID=UPI003F98550E
MPIAFSCDLHASGAEFAHFWEHTVGSGHATLALRADWQQQLSLAHAELGFRHVRFHGILDDDMGTMIDQNDQPLYSFFNTDQIFDFLVSIGMRPFVELSFMPSMLASTDQTIFRYRANVSPPKDYELWATLIKKIVGHWVDRYGIAEVREWFFEVWNEPNLNAFGDAKQDEYFKLYSKTAAAIKSVDRDLKVGGPATAANAWIEDTIQFSIENGQPLDFISTHHYPTDSFGKPGDDTVTQLAMSTRSALRDEAQTARKQAGDRPLYYTEWCTSSNPRDHMHDEPYAAAFIAKTVMEARGLVQGYSYWTFSDIFEENYFPSIPFHGGFGLMNIHGIPKPAYRAFELLHALGNEILEVVGEHDTVDIWVTRASSSITVLISNFALPQHPIGDEEVHLTMRGPNLAKDASVRVIDATRCNPRAHWEELGSPEYLSGEIVERLKQTSRLREESLKVSNASGTIDLAIVVKPYSVTAINIVF